MRIGILTGGGDVPGLNACIKAFVNRAEDERHEVVGIRRGWAGLLYWQAGDLASEAGFIVPLDKQYVRTVDRTGGTFLHSSRTNPAKVGPQAVPEFLSPGPSGDGTVDLTQHVLKLIEHLGLEAL